ncbi:MAG: hypothetical protein IT238_09885 [Bacteroidia bacterium]|nr:hypothetical protein [Bacteroidia bacterium]
MKPLALLINFFVFILVIPLLGYGQNDSLSAQKYSEIEFVAEFTAKSNAFPNKFYTDFYKGGYLDENLKMNASKRLKTINRFGADAHLGLRFNQSIDTLFGQSGWGYIIKAAEKRHLNLEITRDFFIVGFHGNEQYEGDTARLAEFKLNFISWQQLGGGLERSWKAKNFTYRAGIVLSFLNGHSAQWANIEKADLYTAPDGRYLSLDFKGTYYKSDTLKKRPYFKIPSNGMGFGLDMYYQLTTKNNHHVQVMLNDWGYLYWKSKPSAHYTLDTLLRFEGINIPNLLSINDSLLSLSVDSLKQNIISKGHKSFKTALPGNIQISYIHSIIPNTLSINTGVKMRVYDTSYRPMVYVGTSYRYNKKLGLNFNAGFGGYGILNCSLFLHYLMTNRFIIGVGSNQIEGVVSPQTANGESIVLFIKSRF